MRPNQWLMMRAADGELTLMVRVSDVDADLVFRDRDLDDLLRHVTVAVSQRDERRARSGSADPYPPGHTKP